MPHSSPETLLVGIFNDHEKATELLEELIERGFPMDQVSLLNHAGGPGDDFLGISYHGVKERMKVWGLQGAAWGGLLGLLAGVSGLFMVPGLGAVLIAGPLVEALGGAVLGGAGMAGAAAATQLAGLFHRIGVPHETIEAMHKAIEDGHYLLILHTDPDEAEPWQVQLNWGGALRTLKIPLGAACSEQKNEHQGPTR